METDAKLSFESLLINRGDDGVVGERHFLAVALPVACDLESTFKFLLLIHSNLFRISRAIAFS